MATYTRDNIPIGSELWGAEVNTDFNYIIAALNILDGQIDDIDSDIVTIEGNISTITGNIVTLNNDLTTHIEASSAHAAANISLPGTATYNMMNNVDDAIANIYTELTTTVTFNTIESDDVDISKNPGSVSISLRRDGNYTGNIVFALIFKKSDNSTIVKTSFIDAINPSANATGGNLIFNITESYPSSAKNLYYEIWQKFGTKISNQYFSDNVPDLLPLYIDDDSITEETLRSIADNVADKIQVALKTRKITVGTGADMQVFDVIDNIKVVTR